METTTNGNEMNLPDLTETRDQLRARSAYSQTRRFVLALFVLAAIGGIFSMFLAMFDAQPTEEHSVARILLFLWLGIPLIIQAARYLNRLAQIWFDLADAALSREARASSARD